MACKDGKCGVDSRFSKSGIRVAAINQMKNRPRIARPILKSGKQADLERIKKIKQQEHKEDKGNDKIV